MTDQGNRFEELLEKIGLFEDVAGVMMVRSLALASELAKRDELTVAEMDFLSAMENFANAFLNASK